VNTEPSLAESGADRAGSDGLRPADPIAGGAGPSQGPDRQMIQTMFNRVARRYDAANRVMSGGIDIVWRRKAITRLGA
jgi:hypothetical protein